VRRQQRRIGKQKGRAECASAKHEPGLVEGAAA
jgi:hypothetical protein